MGVNSIRGAGSVGQFTRYPVKRHVGGQGKRVLASLRLRYRIVPNISSGSMTCWSRCIMKPTPRVPFLAKEGGNGGVHEHNQRYPDLGILMSPSGSNREFCQVDPAFLHVPPGRSQGADPAKLAGQIAKYGRSIEGMPPLEVVRGKAGELRINDGVTRATRVAKLLPGQTVLVEVIQALPNLDVTRYPRIKDVLP